MKKTLLHSGISINRKPPVNYNEIDKEGFIKLQEYIEPCYLCELNNAYVSPYGVVFKNGRVVEESIYSMFINNRNSSTFYKKFFLNKVTKISGECLIAHNAYYNNYYHWTLEALPRIFSVKQHTPNLKLLIHERSTPFIDTYLSFFEFKDIIKIKDDELVLAEKLFLPMHTAPGLRHNEQLVRDLADFVKTNVTNNLNSSVKKVFISRKNATFRKAINEDQVFGILKELGFEKIQLEKLNLNEQINLMRKVEIFTGIHGAGFSNLMYMNNGKTLIDIIHNDHPQDAFYNLACAFNIDYVRLGAEGVGVQKYCGSDDIKVDIKKLESLINYL